MAELSTLRGEIDLTIGSAEGEPEYQFEFVLALTRDADGRIYVGDLRKENVRVYDADGRYLFHLLALGVQGMPSEPRVVRLRFFPS